MNINTSYLCLSLFVSYNVRVIESMRIISCVITCVVIYGDNNVFSVRVCNLGTKYAHKYKTCTSYLVQRWNLL